MSKKPSAAPAPAAGSNFPKLHNAMWPGLVGKGSPGAEPFIELDTMLDLTAKAEVNGVKFDGVDLFLYNPHTDIDISDDGLKQLAEKIQKKGLVVGSVVAPVWFDASAGGDATKRANFVTHVRKAIRIATQLRELGVRPYGVVRIDSATSVTDWDKDPKGTTKLIAQTFREAGKIAKGEGERLAAEGEICWGGMHSWKSMVRLLEAVDLPGTVGFQADLAHTYLYLLGVNAPKDALLDRKYSRKEFDKAYAKLVGALRPWTIDFHVAQNDGTVHGTGTHEKTGRHCPADDPNGKLDIAACARHWLEGAEGRGIRHLCWDGCMFPNALLEKQETWNTVLRTMIAVDDARKA